MERKRFCKQYIYNEVKKLVKEGDVLCRLCPSALSHIREEHIYISDAELIDKACRQTENASKFRSEKEAENCIEELLISGFEALYSQYVYAYERGWDSFKVTWCLEEKRLIGFMKNRKTSIIYEAMTPYVSALFMIDHSTDARLPFGMYIKTAFPEMYPPAYAKKEGVLIPYTDRNLLKEIQETYWYASQDKFTKGFIDLSQDTENGLDVWMTPSGGGKIIMKFSYHAVNAEIVAQKYGADRVTFRIRTTVGKRTDVFLPERGRDMEALKRFRPYALKVYEEVKKHF